MRSSLLIKTAFLVAALAAISLPADAKKPDHAAKHKNERPALVTESINRHETAQVFFSDDSREKTKLYLRNTYTSHCPPGLAKKNNGCLPPGQAKKYQIGGILPPDYKSVPHDLFLRLGSPPVGTFYAMVDQDVLLVTAATKKILDAVTLLSALD